MIQTWIYIMFVLFYITAELILYSIIKKNTNIFCHSFFVDLLLGIFMVIFAPLIVIAITVVSIQADDVPEEEKLEKSDTVSFDTGDDES